MKQIAVFTGFDSQVEVDVNNFLRDLPYEVLAVDSFSHTMGVIVIVILYEVDKK